MNTVNHHQFIVWDGSLETREADVFDMRFPLQSVVRMADGRRLYELIICTVVT